MIPRNFAPDTSSTMPKYYITTVALSNTFGDMRTFYLFDLICIR